MNPYPLTNVRKMLANSEIFFDIEVNGLFSYANSEFGKNNYRITSGSSRYIDLDRGIKLKGWEIIASETHFSIGRLHQIERKALDSIIKRLHTITH